MRHTTSLRDWSSDVCSSDLADIPGADRAVSALNALRDRIDELQKRVRGLRSEERRVGKECRSRSVALTYTKTNSNFVPAFKTLSVSNVRTVSIWLHVLFATV